MKTFSNFFQKSMKNLLTMTALLGALVLTAAVFTMGCDSEGATNPTVTLVTVNPGTATVVKGGSQILFTAEVSGTNKPPQAVTWSVAGKTATSTNISPSGLLTVAADETETSLTVTATSTYDTVKSGSAKVKVTVSVPVPVDMVYVAPGTFQMGSPSDEKGRYIDEKQHLVTITRGYYISNHEVTQGEFEAVMGTNPSTHYANYGLGADYPIYYVNWHQAIAYCNKLSLRDGRTPAYSVNGISDWAGLANSAIPSSSDSPSNNTWDKVTCDWDADGYRLPTEAEWEYASRGGASKNYKTYSGSNTVDEVAWYNSNSDSSTHTVKTKAPNELGIYDMSGNVYEWCWDWYSPTYYDSRPDPDPDPKGPDTGSLRVARGGSWFTPAYGKPDYNKDDYLRSAYRFGDNAAFFKSSYVGFRIVCP